MLQNNQSEDESFLNIQPSPSALVQALRDIGYSMESAVADVIDNSITADASLIHKRFAWNQAQPWFAIIDDGTGMTSAEMTIRVQQLENMAGKSLDIIRLQELAWKFAEGVISGEVIGVEVEDIRLLRGVQ